MNAIKQKITNIPSEPFTHEFEIDSSKFEVNETHEENVFELRCEGQSFDYIFSKHSAE